MPVTDAFSLTVQVNIKRELRVGEKTYAFEQQKHFPKRSWPRITRSSKLSPNNFEGQWWRSGARKGTHVRRRMRGGGSCRLRVAIGGEGRREGAKRDA
jgi:N-glycosylase/DNA lyase